MRFTYFSPVFVLSGVVILTVAGSATAQTASSSLEIYTSFAGQYDTSMGWRTDYGNASVGNPMAEPTIAAGISDGQTRLILGANNSLGQFFNALHGPDDYHNAQQDLASVFSGVLPSGFAVTQPQVLRDPSPYNFRGSLLKRWSVTS